MEFLSIWFNKLYEELFVDKPMTGVGVVTLAVGIVLGLQFFTGAGVALLGYKVIKSNVEAYFASRNKT